MGAIYVLFLLCSPLRLSFVSVVFDFNALNNDALPVTPKVLSVDLMRLKKRCLLIGAICSFLLSHHSDQVE